jgi:hypothetical protein
MEDDRFKDLREKFFRGDMGLSEQPQLRHAQKRPITLSPQSMMNRVDRRLKQVVVRAYTNSAAASAVMDKLEDFLIQAFGQGKTLYEPKREVWDEILLEPPTVTRRKDSKQSIATFFFHADAPTGGFYRLLLHGLCQFHGLTTVSSKANVAMREYSKARVLTATGTVLDDGYRLTKHLESLTNAESTVEQ